MYSHSHITPFPYYPSHIPSLLHHLYHSYRCINRNNQYHGRTMGGQSRSTCYSCHARKKSGPTLFPRRRLSGNRRACGLLCDRIEHCGDLSWLCQTTDQRLWYCHPRYACNICTSLTLRCRHATSHIYSHSPIPLINKATFTHIYISPLILCKYHL